MTSVSTEWPPFPIRYVIRALRYSILALASATNVAIHLQCNRLSQKNHRSARYIPLTLTCDVGQKSLDPARLRRVETRGPYIVGQYIPSIR